MHSKHDAERLSKIQAAINQLALLLEDGEQIELWHGRGTTYCKVGFEETDSLPVRCIADASYMLAAAKAVHQAENNKSGLISDSDYFR